MGIEGTLRMVPPRRRTPKFLFACAVTLLTGQLASLAHLLFVEHDRCAEHGEIVEADSRVEVHSRSGFGEHGALVHRAATETGAHDHCLLLATLRESFGTFRSDASSGAVASEIDRASHDRASPLSDRALFRLAPKNSPPAI